MQSNIAVASRALRRFQGAGPTASAVPTPERLLKAGGLAHIEIAPDTQGSAALKVPRIRMTNAPLDEMAKRRRLDPDPERAEAMVRAGRRYLMLWRRAGLSPLQGQDPGKIRSTAPNAGLLVGPDDLLGAERQVEAFRDYVSASNAMRPDTRRAVEAVVFHEMSLLDAGAKADPHVKDRTSRITLGGYELKKGLRDLAVHFGMMEPEAVPPEIALSASLPPEMAALMAALDKPRVAGA